MSELWEANLPRNLEGDPGTGGGQVRPQLDFNNRVYLSLLLVLAAVCRIRIQHFHFNTDPDPDVKMNVHVSTFLFLIFINFLFTTSEVKFNL